YLKHKAGEHEAALADFDAALRLKADYPHAHRQRAETLLALGRDAEAGRALDRCLMTSSERRPEVYLARGMIHAKLGDHPAAIEAYTLALGLKQDALTRSQRGWSYLQTDSARLALADFDAALKLGPATSQALCGRALARVRSRQVEAAVQDAEAALKLPD